MCFCKNRIEKKPKVTVAVNVTKIAGFCCIAGILMTGIIFGTRLYSTMLESKKKDTE